MVIILFIGSLVHFWRGVVLMHRLEWPVVTSTLKKTRSIYGSMHARLMKSGFGKGHDFERKRVKLDKSKFLMVKLEVLERRADEEEERFEELRRHLGQQYCHGLEPSAVGFKRCIAHLILEQIRTYVIVAIIVIFEDRIL